MPSTAVHIVHGRAILSDRDIFWIVAVFAELPDAKARIDKLQKLVRKLEAKPNDQYARHKETWQPLDPDAYNHFVKDRTQGFLEWQIFSCDIIS